MGSAALQEVGPTPTLLEHNARRRCLEQVCQSVFNKRGPYLVLKQLLVVASSRFVSSRHAKSASARSLHPSDDLHLGRLRIVY